MSFPIQPDQIATLETFLTHVKAHPSILHDERLLFFKNFIEDLGGKIPPRETDTNSKNAENKHEDVEMADEKDDSDLELDMSGVIEPDTDEPQPMGDSDKVPTEEEIAQAQEKRSEAVSAFVEKDYEKAVQIYTEAILLNPQAALLYAKRGQIYLYLNKPNACIRDCNHALTLNADSAAAHKFRGRAYQLLGKWKEAAADLRLACKFDFDEEADTWLKEVTPNATKIENHKRKKERELLEKLEKELEEKTSKMRDSSAKTQEKSNFTFGKEGPVPGPGETSVPPELFQFLKDPDVIQAFKDPEVMVAFTEISTNPVNILKYQSNPKIMALIRKLTSKYGKSFETYLADMNKTPGAKSEQKEHTAPDLD